jgi:hypothetical protein
MSDSSFLGAGAAAGCTGTGFAARRGCTKPYHNMPPETGGDRIMLLRLTADCQFNSKLDSRCQSDNDHGKQWNICKHAAKYFQC